MDSDGELDIVEQAERTALEDAEQADDEPQYQEVQRDVNEDDVEEVQADGNEEDEGTRKVIKPKRIVRNPQPKLNAETLRGPRGLTALPTLFAKQKFKGKGHEATDLNVILKTYEYWCHRLFPKMRFDQCIEKIETLGSKKPVMTYVKRIRMGILDEEPADPKPAVSDDEVESTPQQQQQIESVEARFDSFAHKQTKVVELTEEQREIIRVNKERAMKLRAERLRRIQEQAEAKLGVSSVLPSQETQDTENTSFNESAGPSSGIHDKTTQNISSAKSQSTETQNMQKDERGVAEFDDIDDDEFMTLSSQIDHDDSVRTPQESQVVAANNEADTNDEMVAVDDLLNNLSNTEEAKAETSADSVVKTVSDDIAMDVDDASDMATENSVQNQDEEVIGVDDLLNNLDDTPS